MTSSMLDGSIPDRSTTALMGIAARSSARTDASEPPCLPTGVRSAAQMNASRSPILSSTDLYRPLHPLPSSEPHPHRLRLRVIVQRFLPEIPAEARELVAAERRGGIIEVVRVDPHGPGLDRPSHAVRPLHILGPNPGREAVPCSVCELDALGFVLEREHRQDRAKDLLVHDLHPGRGVVEHSRLDVEALSVHLGRLAAGHQAGPVLRSRGDVGQHRLLLPPGHDGAEPRVLVERIAGRELLRSLGELLHHLVMHTALYQEARAGSADFTFAVENAALGPAHRGGEISVRKDDVRTLAAELERQPFDRPRGLALDPLADLGGPREGDLVHQRMTHERRARGRPGARDDVQGPGRQAGFDRDLPEHQGGEGSFVRRLEHHGAPGREGRGDFPGGQVQREVPRHDRPDHADRLAHRVGKEGAAHGQRITGELIGPAGVIAERLDRHPDVDLRLEQRLAVVLGLDLGDLPGALLEQFRDAIEQLAAPPGGEITPVLRLEAGARRLHGRVHLRLARLGDLGERLLGRGIGEAVALSGAAPLVRDQQVGLHRPLNSAMRFSTLAAIPSFASSLWNSCCCSSRSSASAVSKGISAPVWTDRLMRPTAFDALCGGQNCFAYRMTCSQNSFAGRISCTMPSSLARSNENSSPFAINSIARALPTSRASRWVPPVPGSTPRFTSGSPILPAFSLASRMSHAIAISSPPPTVWPFSAAIVSLGVCSRRLRVSLACRQKKNLKRGVTVLSIPMLAPAEKNLSPRPRSTITWTLSSNRARRIASSS